MTRGQAMALGVALAAAVAARPPAGGWALVTVADVPDAWIVGRPLELACETRAHGNVPMGGLRPRVEARSGALLVTGETREVTEGGRRGYRGRIAFPSPGEWEVTIHGGAGRETARLLPFAVVDTAGPVRGTVAAHLASLGVRPVSAWERGRRAFVARGCVACHGHASVGVAGDMPGFGPTLSDRRWPPDYLARFLANPAIGPGTNGRRMPNLGLRDADIALLVGFLNGDGRTASR